MVPAGMRFRLVPTDDRFFDLFAQSAANVAEAARRLRDRVTAPTDVSPIPTEMLVAPAGSGGVVQVAYVHDELLANVDDSAK